jgi:Asp-tRNA(Asn)/Glu-tRNA(Gln) amidotransferase A subunit family amidase
VRTTKAQGLRNFVPEINATVVEKLLCGNAGQTNMHEMAYDHFGQSALWSGAQP